MAYVREGDLLRQEVIHQVGGIVSFWPKVPGIGPVAISPNTAPYTIYHPDGRAIAVGDATIADAGDGTDRFDVLISFGGSFTSELLEGYRIQIDWTWPTDSIARRDLVLFDIVRYPFASESLISLRELREIRPTINIQLEKIGRLMGLDPLNGDLEDQAASIFAGTAKQELDAKIRTAATELGTIRPRLILDRQRLARVERYLAIALIFESTGKGNVEEAEDESSQLARFFRGQAEAAWRSIGTLQYDSDEDGVPESEVKNLASVTFLLRVQG